MWRINIDPPSDEVTPFSMSGEDRWWEQTDLTKLILAGNLLLRLSEEIKCLPALTVLDVRKEGGGREGGREGWVGTGQIAGRDGGKEEWADG